LAFVFPPHIPLAQLPTPIETLSRLSKKWAGPQLLVKRDDLTGTPLSGNKVRKLEFFAKAAINSGCDTLITCGGIQSNHARATAIVAAKLGLSSYLVLRGDAGDSPDANLLLDRLVGAEVKFVTREQYFQVDSIMQQTASNLARAVHKAYIIPEGGSNALGCMGYMKAVKEIKQELETSKQSVDYIITPVGSGGTMAGLILGAKLFGLDSRVIGINVSSTAKHHCKRILAITTETIDQFGLELDIDPQEIEIIDGYVGLGYARSRPEEIDLLRLVAQTEGLILDPVYTGKTMYGLASEINKGRFKPGQTILFIHSGGIFGLFAKSLEENWQKSFAHAEESLNS
jgi:D-cysteine desulfhydrase